MDDRSSSPDPLAESFNDDSKMLPRRCSGSIADAPKQKSLVHSDDVQMSPLKTVTEQNLSPWRIRVTVEAEPEDDTENKKGAQGDEGRRRTITKTMKIPLRDNSESPTKPRRSSPARSSGSRARRSVSPGKRRPSVTDLNAIVLGDDDDADEWTGKPVTSRRRRSSNNNAKRKSAASRKSTEPADFPIQEDEPLISEVAASSEPENSPVHSRSPELREIDLNRVAMRPRGASVRKERDKENLADGFRKVSVNSMMSYPTPSPTASEAGNSDDKQDDLDDIPVGMDTVMESEGFTMIDLDSLPSVKQLRSSPVEQSHTKSDEDRPLRNVSQMTLKPQKTMAAPAINLSVVEEEDVSDQEHHLPSSPPKHSSTEIYEESSNLSSAPSYTVGHLKLPSSTNIQRQRHVTPMPLPVDSSPKLPSPPKQARVTKERSPAIAEKALEAGVALQSAVNPVLSEVTPNQARAETNLFEGFSSGTTRELRAGLRFGEELAKKPLRDLQQGKTNDAQAREQLAHEERSANFKAQDEGIWQQGRDDVIHRAAESQQTITISDDESAAEDSSQEEIIAADETLGDIWLAAAKKTPKPSPKHQSPTNSDTRPNAQPTDGPRRKLIPSPWKRGEQIEAPDISTLTADTSMSGLFWKQPESSSSGHRFGEEILAQPSRLSLPRTQAYSRRVSGEATTRGSVSHDDDLFDPQPELPNGDLEWRDATEVVEEETNELEAEKELNNMTHLHETNLEDVPEQDMTYPVLKPLKFQHYDPNEVQDDDDSQVAVSEDSSHSEVERYRQRTSLSPSKERPSTPRSALKGGRLSLGVPPYIDLAEDNHGDRKVAWARRSTCMNEDWEESTRSVRSSQEDTVDETPTPVADKKVEPENENAQKESNSRSGTQLQQKKGWFSWMRKDDTSTNDQTTEADSVAPKSSISRFDGSTDDVESDAETSFIPTSKHDHPHGTDTIVVKVAPSSSTSKSIPRATVESKTPSYLLPPSYPSDPTRNSDVPLSTSGIFTKTHLRTMHIIYAKSRKPRFHGPLYPDQVRGEIRQLVESGWKLDVDESKSFLGEVFTFKVGITEATVLERFMREIEHGYSGEDVPWSWSAVDLARWLGRVAVGEVVRAEEKAVKS